MKKTLGFIITLALVLSISSVSAVADEDGGSETVTAETTASAETVTAETTASVETVTAETTASAQTEPAEEATTNAPEENATDEDAETNAPEETTTDEKAETYSEDGVVEIREEDGELGEELGLVLDGADPDAKYAGPDSAEGMVITTGADTAGAAKDLTWLWIALGGVGAAAVAAAVVLIIRAKKK